MIGHGGPRPSKLPLACWMQAAACWVVSLALWPAAECCAQIDAENSEPPALRLRIEWGGAASRAWQGAISVSQGRISSPQLLGIDADEAASMWLENGRLLIAGRGPRWYDGVDLSIHAPLDASLVVQLAPQDNPAAGGTIETPLAKLVRESHNGAIDDQQNRLLIRRVPGDKLRVSLASTDRLVFDCGEEFQFAVQPWRVEAPAGSKLRLLARLLHPQDGRELWTHEEERTVDEDGTTEPVALAVPLPEEEGVYDLALEASRRGLPNRLGWKHVVEERRIQLTALSSNPHLPDAGSTPPTDVVVEIDPANPAWWKRLATIPMIPGLPKGPLGSGDAAVWQHPQKLGQLIQLGVSGGEPSIPWEAYALPIQRPGQVHIVEVEYPADVPQTLGVSLVEPNSAGAVLPIGLDSGVYLPGEAADGAARMAKHRLVCWPRTKTPLLLLTNRRDGSPAVFGKIRVLGPKVNPVAAAVKRARDDDETRSYLPRRFASQEVASSRLLAGYYDRPLFPENFSAGDSFDNWSGRSLDDWRTFYEGSTRLADYLHYVGYNGLMISVLADGSAIYPSGLVDSTPRYDTGVFFANAQDPVRKDVLELLFRIFDREGLTLIPAVDFSMPLRALEEVRRRGGPESEGIELIDGDRRRRLASHPPRQGLAPYYNPLHERVQEEMLAVVRELAERYKRHPSFGGVALQLSADGYAQLPGADCGYDDETLARFQRDTGVKLPPGESGFAERVELLRGPKRQAWLHWRAAALSLFYRRMQAELAADKSELKLYLAGAHLFDRPDLRRELEPALSHGTTKNQDALLGVGIDPELYRDLEGVVLLRPQRVAPLNSLPAHAVNLELNLDGTLDRLFADSPHGGSLFYHEPQEARLLSFEAKSPFKHTVSWLAAQPTPSGAYNRSRFIHALATLDAKSMFDGGWMLPLGQENELNDVVAVYRRLPDAPFALVEGKSAGQPVVIRTLSQDGRTYIYLANDSPWKSTVSLSVNMPDCAVRSLNPSRRLPGLTGTGAKRTWTMALEPYDLVGAAFTSPNVTFSDPQISLPEQTPERLKEQIDDLFLRAAVLKDPPPMEALKNPGFEQTASSGIPGWETNDRHSTLEQLEKLAGAETPPNKVQLDTRQPHSGRAAARLSTDGEPAMLTSEPFAAPKTGWLSVSVWLRTADAARQPDLWLVLEGRLGGQSYIRKAPIGQGPGGSKLDSEWNQYVFLFPELPAEGLSPLRLRFQLQKAGEAWIDDIRLFDLEKLDDRRALALVMSIQLADLKLKQGQLGDCRQLLEGYWPRYLTANVPLAHSAAEAPRRGQGEPTLNAAKPSMFRRVKENLWKR